MNKTAKYGLGCLIAGVVLAILFVILAAANAGGHATAYIGAAATCGVAAVAGLVLFLTNKNKAPQIN